MINPKPPAQQANSKFLPAGRQAKQTQINQTQNSKPYVLGERTLVFSRKAFSYVKQLTRVITNLEMGKQLVRSVGSVGANYIEAEKSLNKKDFLMRIEIARKEAKESRYWLVLSEPLDGK